MFQIKNIDLLRAKQLKMLTQMFGNAPSDCDFPEFVVAIVTTLCATTHECIFYTV